MINGLVQESYNSCASAMELRLSSTNPPISYALQDMNESV